jgi:Protein of unknown function (DUF2442)
MHFVKDVEYLHDYELLLQFEDGSWREVDLKDELYGEVFEPLKNKEYFKTVKVNHDLDTIVWDNDADISPDYLFEISTPVDEEHRQFELAE